MPSDNDIPRTLLAGTSVDVVKYAAFSPPPGFTGDSADTALNAGESCRCVHGIKPAAQIVREVLREAEKVMAQIQGH